MSSQQARSRARSKPSQFATLQVESDTALLKPRSQSTRHANIPIHLTRPAVTPVEQIKAPTTQNLTTNADGKPLTFKQKKDLQIQIQKQQAEARKQAKYQRFFVQLMSAIKELYLDNKMEDQSISDTMLEVTVRDAKETISQKLFLAMIFERWQKEQHMAKTAGAVTKSDFV